MQERSRIFDGMMDVDNQYGTRERQYELLSMMKDMHIILKQTGIRYSLAGGSLLGAIRDKGFIPWDDDIDIMVDRDNYEKLLKTFKSSQVINGCEYVIKRKLWVERIKKVLPGRLSDATIDVFIIDNIPTSKFKSKIKEYRIKCLQGMMKTQLNLKNYGFISKILLTLTYIIGKLFTDEYKYKRYQKISTIGNKEKTRFVTCYNDLFKCLSLKYNNYIMDKIIVVPFENINVYISEDYDAYLRTQYGDYLIPPKIEERKGQHI